jgi:hypothetical protein
MTRYNVRNSVGDFPASDAEGTGEEPAPAQEDTTAQVQEQRSRLLPPAPEKQKIMNMK